jgi:hypothetical protein
MSYNLNDTRSSVFNKIEKASKDLFKDHIIIPEQENGPIRMWLCQNKNKSNDLHFRVVSGPGLLAVYGDIGQGMLRIYGSDTVSWIRGAKNSIDYVIEKMVNVQKVFMPGEALALINDADADDEEEQKFLNTVNKEWSEYIREDYGSEFAFIEAWSNAGGEIENIDSAFDWDRDVYWTVMCLQKFVELFNNNYFPEERNNE